MKSIKLVITLFTVSSSTVSLAISGASENISAASKHSVLSISHGVNASGQIVSGVVAVPLLVVGHIGSISMVSGEALMKNAIGSEVLTVTDITITADPAPHIAMENNEEEK